MKFFYKLEKKFGKLAIRNLMKYIIVAYIIGYVLQIIKPELLALFTLEPYSILRGQVWRLVTWLIVPSETFDLFTILMFLLYYNIGTNLERYWGTFKFNLYMFGGFLFTAIAAFVLYFIFVYTYGVSAISVDGLFSTYYVNMSLFLAFAACFPNAEVRIYFILPVKMKWMGVLYGALVAYSVWYSDWVERTAIFASLLNFIIFFFATRNWRSISPKEIKRKNDYKKKVTIDPTKTRHKCAVCGRTEKDDPTLVFRYCSKCDGNFEYCQDHLFTHEHIKRS